MCEKKELTPAERKDIAVIQPVLEQLFKPFYEVLESVAASQQMISDRMGELEKQWRLSTLVTPVQVKYLNAAVKEKAKSVLMKKSIEDAKYVRKLANAIRKKTLVQFGIGKLNELPRFEYPVAMSSIENWYDSITIIKITAEVRKEHESG